MEPSAGVTAQSPAGYHDYCAAAGRCPDQHRLSGSTTLEPATRPYCPFVTTCCPGVRPEPINARPLLVWVTDTLVCWAVSFDATVQTKAPEGACCMASIGTESASCCRRSTSFAFTNSPGHSRWPLFANVAFKITVPLVRSAWLLIASSVPVSSLCAPSCRPCLDRQPCGAARLLSELDLRQFHLRNIEDHRDGFDLRNDNQSLRVRLTIRASGETILPTSTKFSPATPSIGEWMAVKPRRT